MVLNEGVAEIPGNTHSRSLNFLELGPSHWAQSQLGSQAPIFSYHPAGASGVGSNPQLDLNRHFEQCRRMAPNQDWVVLAHREMADLSGRWVLDYAPKIQALVWVQPSSLCSRLWHRAAEIEIPILVIAEEYPDWFERLPAARRRLLLGTGQTRDIQQFLLDLPDLQAPNGSLLLADRQGPSAEAYLRRQIRPGWLDPSLNFYWWWTVRLAANTIGRLSKGVTTALQRGFSSGENLDYAYQNRPQGWSWLGRRIDRFYLNQPGFVHVRTRRQNLLNLLEESVLLAGRRQLKIVDLAGGPAHYLLDLLQSNQDADWEVVVNDFDPSSVAAGQRLAEQLGESRIRYQRGDGLDPDYIASLGPCDIVVASGFFEQYPQNPPVQKALKAISQVLKAEGRLLCTNMPQTPLMDILAHCFHHADGSPWLMRGRSNAEIDDLLLEAGLRCRSRLSDCQGRYSVTLAEKRP